MRTWQRDDGQAAVELIALLPLVALLAAGAWQLAVAGHAAWSADAAARAAARAAATGGDARAAARQDRFSGGIGYARTARFFANSRRPGGAYCAEHVAAADRSQHCRRNLIATLHGACGDLSHDRFCTR